MAVKEGATAGDGTGRDALSEREMPTATRPKGWMGGRSVDADCWSVVWSGRGEDDDDAWLVSAGLVRGV